MINKCMKIHEITESIDKLWDEVDAQYNPENLIARDHEQIRYMNIAKQSQGETPVFTKDKKQKEKFSNLPGEDDIQSPGYRGGESAKKRAGVPHRKYDKRNVSLAFLLGL